MTSVSTLTKRISHGDLRTLTDIYVFNAAPELRGQQRIAVGFHIALNREPVGEQAVG